MMAVAAGMMMQDALADVIRRRILSAIDMIHREPCLRVRAAQGLDGVRDRPRAKGRKEHQADDKGENQPHASRIARLSGKVTRHDPDRRRMRELAMFAAAPAPPAAADRRE